MFCEIAGDQCPRTIWIHFPIVLVFLPFLETGYLTKIWETSRYVFVRLLLGHLRTDGQQTWQGGWGWARKKSPEVRFHGNPFVAMLTRKFSHSHDIGSRVMIFCEQSYISLINSLAKNEHNLPHGLRDIPWQPPVSSNAKRHQVIL